MIRRRARSTSITISGKTSMPGLRSSLRIVRYVLRQSARYTQHTSVKRESNRHHRTSISLARATFAARTMPRMFDPCSII